MMHPARADSLVRLRPEDVLDSLAAHIAVLDEAGVIIAVNRPWRDFAAANGAAGAVAEGADYLRTCDQAEGEGTEAARAIAQGIRDVLTGRCAEFVQEYPCHAPARERWFVGRVTRLAGEGPPRAIVTHEDITPRKQAEDARRASEEHVRLLLDSTGEAIYGIDLEGRCTLCNSACLRLLGFAEPSDLLGKHMHSLMHHTRADGTPYPYNDCRIYQAYLREEELHVEDEVLWRADGTSFPAEYWSYPMRRDGRVVGAVVTFINITARRQSELVLRQSEERLRLALEAARMGWWDWDIVSDKVVWSENMPAVLGLPDGTFRSTFDSFQQLIHPDDRDAVELTIDETIKVHGVCELEFRVPRPDGSFAWMLGKGRVLYEEDARPARMLGVGMDITERRRAERQIFVLNAELETRLQRLHALRRIDTAITASLDLPLTLGIVVDEVLTGLEVDAAGILLSGSQMPVLEYAVRKGYRSEVKRGQMQRLDDGPAGRAVLGRCTQRVCQPSADSDGPLPGEGFVSYWAVPLTAKGRVRGVLEVGHRSSMNPEPEWLDFLEALAGQAAIAVENAELFEGLYRANLEMALAYDATIEGWSRAMDLRDHETEGHSRRVTETTLRLARAVGVAGDELVQVRRGALLHDIGKIGIPDHILLKPGPLTDDELAVMRRHPQYALEMLAPIAFLRPALDIPYGHHEKWDGTGYPRGLKGEQIPLAARIFAVVDIWDALMSDRPYRKGWPPEAVHEHLRSLAGTHLDPAVVTVFLKLLSKE